MRKEKNFYKSYTGIWEGHIYVLLDTDHTHVSLAKLYVTLEPQKTKKN